MRIPRVGETWTIRDLSLTQLHDPLLGMPYPGGEHVVNQPLKIIAVEGYGANRVQCRFREAEAIGGETWWFNIAWLAPYHKAPSQPLHPLGLDAFLEILLRSPV